MMTSMGLNTVKIDDFSGGVNTVDDIHSLDANEFPFGTTDIEPIGKGHGIRRRRAASQLSTSATLPAVGFGGVGPSDRKAITSLMGYRIAGANADSFIGGSDDGYVFTMPAGGGVATQRIASGGAVNGRLYAFQQSQDSTGVQKIYMCNGVGTPQAFAIGAATIGAWAGTPPNGKCLASWKNRMIVSGVAAQPQRIYYSDIANPESWPANNFIDIKSVDDEDDIVTCLEVIGENLLVFKQKSTWVIFDSITFDNRRLANIGAPNAFCACRLEDSVYWVSDEGVYSTDGDNIRMESQNISNLWTTLGGGLSASRPWFRIASLPTEGKVMMAPGGGNVWVLETRMTRQDSQHPWYAHQANYRYSTAFATIQGSNRTQIVGVLQNNTNTNQELFTLLSKESGSDDFFFNDAIGNFVTRTFPIEGGENMERIRRINILAKTGVSGMSVIVGAEGGPNGPQSFVVNAPAMTTTQQLRIRPETRGRWHSIFLNLFLAETAVYEIELKYRGGKEH